MDKGSYSLATNKLQGTQTRGFREKYLMLTCQILLNIILLVYLTEGRRWPFFYSDGVFDVLILLGPLELQKAEELRKKSEKISINSDLENALGT